MISSQHRKRLCSAVTSQTQDRTGAGLTEILMTIVITVALLVVLTAFFLPAQRRARPAARRAQCKNNLKQISIAIHKYVEDQGALPPAFTVDANGEPLHSWRTLILPYLDQKPLYDRIDLSKPWNDPVNAEAYSTTIHGYVCPSATRTEGYTTCLAMVGPENSFHPTEPRVFQDFTDGLSNTIWVIDASPTEAVHWMDPRDSANSFFLTYNGKSGLSHPGGVHAAFADGSVRFLTDNLPTKTRRGLATIAGGEDISEQF